MENNMYDMAQKYEKLQQQINELSKKKS